MQSNGNTATKWYLVMVSIFCIYFSLPHVQTQMCIYERERERGGGREREHVLVSLLSLVREESG